MFKNGTVLGCFVAYCTLNINLFSFPSTDCMIPKHYIRRYLPILPNVCDLNL